MKKINVNQFKTTRGNSTPLLTLRKNGLVLNKPFFDSLDISTEESETINIEFAHDDSNQLHIRIWPEHSDESALFKPNAKKNEFICHNTGLSLHLKEQHAKECTRPSVPMKVQTGVKVEDGWMPVITSFWKTQK